MEEPKDDNTGISNRETASEEERERREHPSLAQDSEEPELRASDERLDEVPERHTSTKAGSRSAAQKESGSKYTVRSSPSSRKVSGAYGREQGDTREEE